MARKKKEEEVVEEVVEELPESFEDLADDDSPIYSFEEEEIVVESLEEDLEELAEKLEDVPEILEEKLEEVFEDIEEAAEEIIEDLTQAFVEFTFKGEVDLVIPMREQEWDDDIFVITPEYAERMLTNAAARLKKSHGKVVFAGHERQNRFLAFLAAQMLKGEGNVLYLPEELADYGPLQELEKVDDAPEGFVAFSAK